MNIKEDEILWYKITEKHFFIEKLYGGEIPELKGIKIQSLNVNLRKDEKYISSAQLSVIIKGVPKNIPPKWVAREVNGVELVLEILKISGIHIVSSDECESNITIGQSESQITIKLDGEMDGEIICPVEYSYYVENRREKIDNNYLAIKEIRGVMIDT